MNSTINPEEVEKFSRIADEWWDPKGKFAPLHRINPLRIEYIKQQVLLHQKPLAGLSLLDIGCGGGLIAEPMTTLGATVTAIDASEKNIAVAGLHAEKSGLAIDYQCMTAEALAAQGNTFDVVLALEIIEHVANVELFIQSVMQLIKPGGIAILSTMNRTAKAYALAIVGAEYVLRWLPTGTHDWHKFVKPSEMKHAIEANGGCVIHTTGMVMNPLTFEWRLKEQDLSVNYLLVAEKNHAPFNA